MNGAVELRSTPGVRSDVRIYPDDRCTVWMDDADLVRPENHVDVDGSIIPSTVTTELNTGRQGNSNSIGRESMGNPGGRRRPMSTGF